MKIVFKAILAVTIVALSIILVKVIAEPIEFQKEKERRYARVVQRLIDIRKAQFAYKSVKDEYADSFDKLIRFINQDSFTVVYQVGDITDTMAVALGKVIRDTSFVSVRDSLFSGYPVDSLRFVPFSNGKEFKINAGELDISGVKVKVFEVVDGAPFDKYDVMKVGSMEEPTTNGNWE